MGVNLSPGEWNEAVGELIRGQIPPQPSPQRGGSRIFLNPSLGQILEAQIAAPISPTCGFKTTYTGTLSSKGLTRPF